MELENLWNAGTGALKLKGIALKRNISFVAGQRAGRLGF
jgi:hypothetical protein